MKKSIRPRRRFTADEKAAILRRHLADKIPMSDLAEEYGIQPSVLYQLQRQLLDNAGVALQPQRRADRHETRLQAKIEALETRLQKKDAVIAEISEEYVKKK